MLEGHKDHISKNNSKSWLYTFECPEAVNRGFWFMGAWDNNSVLREEERKEKKKIKSCPREKNLNCFQLRQSEVGIRQWAQPQKGMWWMQSCMDTHNCWIPSPLPVGAMWSIVYSDHICTDCRKYCGVISVTALLLVEISYTQSACRNRGACAEGSAVFHVVGKTFWNILLFFFFLLCHLIIARVSQKQVLSFRVTDKGALLSYELWFG